MSKKITPYLQGISAAVVLIGLSGVAAAILSPSESHESLPVPQTPEQAANMANAVMQSKCADCHGVASSQKWSLISAREKSRRSLSAVRAAVYSAKARKIFDINPGDNVLILGDEGQGLAIIKEKGLLDLLRNAQKA